MEATSSRINEIKEKLAKKNYYAAFYALAMAVNDDCITLMESRGKDFVKARTPYEQDSIILKDDADNGVKGVILAFRREGGQVKFLALDYTDYEAHLDPAGDLDADGSMKDKRMKELEDDGYAWWIEIGDGNDYDLSDSGCVYGTLVNTLTD